MTSRRVVEAFMRGEFDRRELVARLTAVGVSVPAASAYAVSLGTINAAAAPQPGDAGIARYQDGAEEEDYDTAISLESDDEGVAYVAEALNAVLGVLGGLAGFTADDFEDGVYAILQTMLDQLLQAEAVAGLFETPQDVAAPAAESYDAVDDFLADLVSALDELVATYAAVVPAIENGATRQTLTEIALATAGYAAVARLVAGEEPFPGPFQVPNDPTD